MTVRPALLLLFLFCASAAAGQSVDDAIRAEVARYVAAINGGDAGAVAALYRDAPGTSSVGDGQIHHGWQRVAGLLGDVYQAAGTIRMTTDSIVVTALGNDAAIAVLRYQWVVGRSNDQPVNGAMTLVYARTPRGWRVVHDHTSTAQLSAVPMGAVMAVADSGPTSPRRQTFSCTVSHITDGDGIVCDRIGRVRLIGMDTPELDQRPFGRQAAAALAALVRVGRQVQLEPDVEARDRYGRVLAYVWVGRTLVNWRMVRDGWAVLLTYPPNVQYVDDFSDAERRAREERRGLWATGGFECAPAAHRRRECE
jgi:micrococcal nuclease